MPYLENMSTLSTYTQGKYGSRPGKRGGETSKLELSDLRAIFIR